MKRITMFAAALLCSSALLAAPAGAVHTVSAASRPFPCRGAGISFNSSYTLRAVLNRACHLHGVWSWRIQTGDYHGFMGPLGSGSGHGNAYTLPVVKATAGRLKGFNPPGYLRASFRFVAKWHGSFHHIALTKVWSYPKTHLVDVGLLPPVKNVGGGGSTVCKWDSSMEPSFDGLTARGGDVVCSGSGQCSWRKMPSRASGTQFYLNPMQIGCTTGEIYHVTFTVFYNLSGSSNSVSDECTNDWAYTSSVTFSSLWGPANVDVQITLITDGSQDLWETPHWVNLSGQQDPCATDWQQ